MISQDDIEAMHPEYYSRPIMNEGNSLLGLKSIIDNLRRAQGDNSTTSIGFGSIWYGAERDRG
jgi:hypothetical protein